MIRCSKSTSDVTKPTETTTVTSVPMMTPSTDFFGAHGRCERALEELPTPDRPGQERRVS